jgi:hypothetical protein|tara:strand:+ start:1011 stop:1358 length:348 start_codon:yes stop_codon:yes gene_type:complete
MSKVKTKVSIKNFEEIIKKIESQGFDLKNLNTDEFQEDGLVSSNMRTINSLQIKDDNGNYYRSTLSFSPVIKDKGLSIKYSKKMTEFKSDFENLKKKYCETMTSKIKNNLMVGKS